MRLYDNDFDPDVFDEYSYVYEFPSDDTAPAKSEPAKPIMMSRKGVALLMALCLAVSGSFGIGSAYFTTKTMQDNIPPSFRESIYATPMNLDLSASTGSQMSVQQIIDTSADAVVEINTEIVSSNIWFGQYITPGAGSGVILTADGYIMTNNHVIENSNKIGVTLRDGSTYDATVVGYDSQTDVAVIKIDAKDLTPVVFGDSDTILMGDLTVAIGNPLGQLGGTATVGIISSLDRQINIEGKTMRLLQTDASINRGNSGGGLFNQYGEMIGLVVAKTEGLGVEGLGFAIPVNVAKNVASQLIDVGYVSGRPQIGIEMVNLTSAQDAIRYGVRNLGVYVSRVLSDGAIKAGFQEGDMLYYLEDIRIEQPADLTEGLANYKVGDTVQVTIIRGNDIIDLSVVLGEQKPH